MQVYGVVGSAVGGVAMSVICTPCNDKMYGGSSERGMEAWRWTDHRAGYSYRWGEQLWNGNLGRAGVS